jgi:hypothetical protein
VKKLIIIGILMVCLMFVGCAGDKALSWRDPMHSVELRDSTTVYEDQDVKQGGRIYKGLYAKVLPYNKINNQYKVLANRREFWPHDIQLQLGTKMLLVVGAFQILHKTGPDEICDSSGLCSSNIKEYTALNYISPYLYVKLRGIRKSDGKELLVRETKYRYRDNGPHDYGNLLAIPVVADVGYALNEGPQKGIHMDTKTSAVWYEIRVEYHDPDNGSGSLIKGWNYTVNK